MTFLGRFDLTDEEYEVLKALLPQERQPHQAGRPWSDHRTILNGLFWRLRTGAPWRAIATRYEKVAESFESVILLRFIRIWLHDLLSYSP